MLGGVDRGDALGVSPSQVSLENPIKSAPRTRLGGVAEISSTARVACPWRRTRDFRYRSDANFDRGSSISRELLHLYTISRHQQ